MPPFFVRVLLGSALLAACSAEKPGAGDPPSLLLITIDTWRHDHLGVAGEAPVATPTLDGLAGAGLYFSNARAHVPLTLPSHAALLTGTLPLSLGVHDNAPFAVDGSAVTLAEQLHGGGYSTAAVIGGQPLARGCGLEQGFERYDDPPRASPGELSLGERTATAITDAALALLATSDSAPQFLWVHYFDPHHPYAPPPRYARADAPAKERYAGEVAYVDAEVGRLLSHLPATGRRWIVTVTSDHGEGLGDHLEDTHGYFPWDSTLRVPLLIAERSAAGWSIPAALQHRRGESWARHIDVTPTLCELAGVAPPRAAVGVSLCGVAEVGPAYVETFAGELQFRWSQVTGVRTQDALLLCTGEAGEGSLPEGIALHSTPDRADEWSDAGPDRLPVLRRWLEAAHDSDRSIAGTLPELPALVELGYLAAVADPLRHRLLSRAENQALPSPLHRAPEVRAILAAIESLDAGSVNAAWQELERLLAADPANPTLRLFASRAQLNVAEKERSTALSMGAARHLLPLVNAEPPDWRALLQYCKALGRGGDFQEALDLLEARLAGESPVAAKELRALLYLEGADLEGRPNVRQDRPRGAELLVELFEDHPLDRALEARLQQVLQALKQAGEGPWLVPLEERFETARRPTRGR